MKNMNGNKFPIIDSLSLKIFSTISSIKAPNEHQKIISTPSWITGSLWFKLLSEGRNEHKIEPPSKKIFKRNINDSLSAFII